MAAAVRRVDDAPVRRRCGAGAARLRPGARTLR